DNKGRVANFKNTIIIMTSNIGAHLIQEKFENFDKLDVFKQLDLVDETRDLVVSELKKTVRPEFVNRIDEIVMFRPLTQDNILEIVRLQFAQVQQRMKENGFVLEASEEALNYLGEKGFDPQYGARPLKRVIQKLVLNEISKAILAGKVKKDIPISIELKNGLLEFVQTDQALATVLV
ncbi:MAG: AAA family ATPase, partial [Cytophagales bacterium]